MATKTQLALAGRVAVGTWRNATGGRDANLLYMFQVLPTKILRFVITKRICNYILQQDLLVIPFCFLYNLASLVTVLFLDVMMLSVF